VRTGSELKRVLEDSGSDFDDFFLENSSKSESEVIVTDSEELLDENSYSSDIYDTAPHAST
jgi:hypothetical protein